MSLLKLPPTHIDLGTFIQAIRRDYQRKRKRDTIIRLNLIRRLRKEEKEKV